MLASKDFFLDAAQSIVPQFLFSEKLQGFSLGKITNYMDAVLIFVVEIPCSLRTLFAFQYDIQIKFHAFTIIFQLNIVRLSMGCWR